MRIVKSLSFVLLFSVAAWTGMNAVAQQGGTQKTKEKMKDMSKGKTKGMDMSKMKMGVLGAATYSMDLELTPRAVTPGQNTQLKFTIFDPQGKQATKFQIMHEKLFHMFIVSEDLEHFVHDHPVPQPDGTFLYDAILPRSGMYRILGDFYPEGADPQLIAKTVYASGPQQTPASLSRDYGPKDGANMRVEFRTVPAQPIAGGTTQLHFHIDPAEGLEQYIGAWGHMLVASDDVIDLIHTHPFIADGGPDMQFNVTFPRARTYRVWVQFQRHGEVNTLQFDVPVEAL